MCCMHSTLRGQPRPTNQSFEAKFGATSELAGIRSRNEPPTNGRVRGANFLKSPAARNAPCVAALPVTSKGGIDWKPDPVIGHNPGALGPLIRISKRLNIPALFDAEDANRGEAARQTVSTTSITQLEDRLLPDLTQMTAASPMIAQAYRKLYPALSVTTVNNAFPLDCLSPKPTASKENHIHGLVLPGDWTRPGT